MELQASRSPRRRANCPVPSPILPGEPVDPINLLSSSG
ncbi:hypothetical protein AMP9_3167 [plant metagenome]|uniref:Uncharacterized protein n=1 Tax=plant metagenome TaxID=1297885 RepID=A0A484NV58_9ZZZZ